MNAYHHINTHKTKGKGFTYYNAQLNFHSVKKKIGISINDFTNYCFFYIFYVFTFVWLCHKNTARFV